MYTAIANARMRRHVTQYKHKVQPRGWTNYQRVSEYTEKHESSDENYGGNEYSYSLVIYRL